MMSVKYVILLASVALNVMYASADDKTLFRLNPDKYTVDEGVGLLKVVVVRDGEDIKAPVEIKYETKSDTAISGHDFVGISGKVVFLPGERSKTITVQIIDDKLAESTEKFSLVLTSAEGGKLGAEKESTITILDNDKK